MKVSIFIPSYRNDIEYARYAMASVKKFADGFHEYVIEVPIQDYNAFRRLADRYGFKVATHVGENPPDPRGGLWQQVVKIYADEHVAPDADYILYLDSDCVFTSPVSPSDYFVDGRPVFLIESFESFRQSRNDRYGWKAVVDANLRRDCFFETMCRHPCVYHTALLPALRRHLQTLHGKTAEAYILSVKPDFMPGFSEFNVLGNYALDKFDCMFHWVDLSNGGVRPTDKVYQAWSKRAPTPEDKAVYEAAGLHESL